jgi:c(7)-type cytochrome triheme protein
LTARIRLLAVAVTSSLALLIAPSTGAPEKFDLPPLPKPARYGDVLIDRLSASHDQKAVGFSHWSHRRHFTCRVCHFELDFVMETNGSGITEEANRQGRFCGACHDGERAFGFDEANCSRCHTGGSARAAAEFKKLKAFPGSSYGNKIDWVQAIDDGLIEPEQSILDEGFEPIEFSKELVLEAEWAMISPAVFPHDAHSQWLDCANCHPDIFNIKKKTTEHFEMRYNLQGKFCGVCHLRVAFPMDDCKRCHPSMKI